MNHSMAKVFSTIGKRTPVTARFSTIAGNLGSPDTVRDLRGLAFKCVAKKYEMWCHVGSNGSRLRTEDGILDWVGRTLGVRRAPRLTMLAGAPQPSSILAPRPSQVPTYVVLDDVAHN